MNTTPHNSTTQTATTLTADLRPIPTALRLTPLRAIRAKCIDCCGGSRSEASKCTARHCDLWLFRLGKKHDRPPRTKKQQRASQKAGQRLAALARTKKSSCPDPSHRPGEGDGSLFGPGVIEPKESC